MQNRVRQDRPTPTPRETPRVTTLYGSWDGMRGTVQVHGIPSTWGQGYRIGVSCIEREGHPMNLLLAAVLLMQDKTAEETFKKIEDSITSAKSLSVKIKMTASNREKGEAQLGSISGTFLLKGDQKLLAEFVATQNGKEQRMSVVCDGQYMQGRSIALPQPVEYESQPRFRNYLELAFVRGGGSGLMSMTAIYCGLVHAARKMEQDPKKMVAVTGLESGKDAGGVYLKFDSKMDHFGPLMKNTLWYDPLTYKPLKSVLSAVENGATMTEVYEDFILNADIPDEKFKLPEEKK